MDLQENGFKKFFRLAVGYVVVIGIIALATGCVLFFTHKNTRNPGKHAEDIKENVLYHVIQVLDGDTLIANVSGHEVTIRMLGIDTPEVVDPRKPVQCYGPEASAQAKELLSYKEVYIEKDPIKESTTGSYDKYGRVLGYIKMPGDFFYNKYMIQNGFAREYTFNKEKYQYQKELKAEQKKAQKGKVGLWGKCSTI